MPPPGSSVRPPRLVVRVLTFAFSVIACVLAAVFVLLSWQARAGVTRAVAETMETSQQYVAAIERQRSRELLLQVQALAENPTLKAAVDTYHAERDGEYRDQLIATIEIELGKLQRLLDVPALSIAGIDGTILASAGPGARDWPAGSRVRTDVDASGTPVEAILERGARVYRTTSVAMVVGLDAIGEFIHASPLDDAYAQALAADAGADVVIVMAGRVIGSSTPARMRDAIERVALPVSGTVTLDGGEYVVQRLSGVDGVGVYAVGSLTTASLEARSEVGLVLVVAGGLALLFAAAGSWWLARTVAGPINRLTTSIAQMAEARDLTQPLPRTGGSRELDSLADTFDGLRTAIARAEAESEATYLGVISTLANALDARDPYTAGHSQRVADLSVSIGREMRLAEADLETLRVGALLHDIGKIGVSDAVLRKASRLTAEEYEQIKLHASLGARILKPLRFFEAQLAIVELHHERPDGRGYPYGLRGDDIPVFARIVHVADAFDAMTSARAYRNALPVSAAVQELRRLIGVDFDAEAVAAMLRLPVAAQEAVAESGERERPGSLVAFPARSADPVESAGDDDARGERLRRAR
jgi:putative nucleotidyltransferase with HDIG domain